MTSFLICRSRFCIALAEKGRTIFFQISFLNSAQNSKPRSERMFRQSGPWATLFSRCQDLLANVAKTSGAIGYAELRCGEKSGLAVARIRNAAGEFVKPSTKSIRDVALAMESTMTDDFRVSLTNAPGKESYPIVSFTWFYVPVHRQDLQRSHAVNEYLSWVYASGQEIAQAQGYAPLPQSVLQKVRAKVAALH